MFRIAVAKALINRFGFNSDGLDVFTGRLKTWRENPLRSRNPVGVNIGKNRDSADEVADYVACLIKVAPYADYVTINISSPNTPGLRDLQNRDLLARLLDKVMQARKANAPGLPLLVKIAFDLTDEEQEDIAKVVLDSGVHGMIVGNTSPIRPSNIPREIAKEPGGLSGPPIFGPSTRVLANMYRLTNGKIPLIANCGVSSGEDAYAKIRAGASLVQIYTALVYEGPLAVRKIKKELAQHLRDDGFLSVAAAVGADHKQGSGVRDQESGTGANAG
jgi:dihydroorotate dehydrogenase